MIEISELYYEYPGVKALNNVSVKIPKGTITALVGPNGSGKTTLLECMAGLKRSYKGQVLVSGIDMQENPREAHKLIGHLPDVFGLYENLTVEQCLRYQGMAHKLSNSVIEQRIPEVLVYLDLEHKASAFARTLSRGMRQRLAIGQTLMHMPQWLILDEPASGLDPEARVALSDLFITLKNKGISLIVSSHILAELDQYANNLLIIRKGKIVESKALFHQEQNNGVITILLSAPHPLLPAYFRDTFSVELKYISETHFELSTQDDAMLRNQMLAQLINKGVPVADFYYRKTTLVEQYLDTL